MQIKVVPLDSTRRDDFFAIHCEKCEMGWCYCTAWWVPNWDGWENRTAEENRALREKLFHDEIHDGYILYADDIPVGWCQCGPRDRLPKIRQIYNLMADPDVWAISCMFLLPAFREIGLAHYFLFGIIRHLCDMGVKYVQGFPKRGKELTAGDIWIGPESLYQKAGFILEQDDRHHPVYGIKLTKEEK
ncbi:MAG: hypothetical protein NTV06_04250 [candidate division Zixibacteria bacterium]|nr:hypothetical protein [candidate division Zixibacteria bacterium]